MKGTEQSIPLVVRPSLELSDEQVGRADSELRRQLRQTFQLPPDSRCFLYEAVSRRSLSAESFRDPNNLPVFPHRWVLTVEPSFQAPLKYGQQPLLDGNDYLRSNSGARDSSPLPSLEDLSLLPHHDHHSSLVLCCGDQGEFGLTLRHFTIRSNIPESNTPEDAHQLDSIGSNDSAESLCLSTLFVYRLEPGGPAERASLKEGDVILKVNGYSVTRCSAVEVQAILQKCGRKLTLLVSPKESDDLQFLYPSYTYGTPGEQTTRDGTVLCCDLVVIALGGGGSGEGHTSFDSSSGEGVASGSLPSLEDPSQRVYLAASPSNLPAHSRQDSLDVFSDPRIQLACSPIHFHESSSPPRVCSENGFLDCSSMLHNLDEMTSTESLEKLAASINPETSPSWSQYLEENGFPSQTTVPLDDHDSLDQVGTKWRGLDSGVGGGRHLGLHHHDEDPSMAEGTTKVSRRQSNEFAVDIAAGSAHPPRARPSLERVTQKPPARKGQNSLEALTRLGDNERLEDTGGRHTPRNQTTVALQESWFSRSDSPSKSDGSPHSQQSAGGGGLQGSQEHGGSGSQSSSSELKGRRTNRSYQSQRAQLHRALGARQSAEGDHPHSSSAHLDGPSSPSLVDGKPHMGRRGHTKAGPLPGKPSPEEQRRSQDAVLPSFVEDSLDLPTREDAGTRYHQRAPSNEERRGYVGGQGHTGKAKRPASAKVPLETSTVAQTTHVSIDEAIEKASQPNRSLSVDATGMPSVWNGLGMRHEPALEEDPVPERTRARKLFATVSVDITESATVPMVEGLLKKEKDDGLGKRSSHTLKQFYCVVDGNKLMFYKDKKDAALRKVCDESPIELTSSSVETSSDYSKKKHMIKVVCVSGVEHIFHMEDEEEMRRWVDAMRGGEESGEGRRRSQPLVSRLSPQGSPVPNRRAVSPTQQPKTAKRRASEFGSFLGKLWRGRGSGKSEEVDSSTSYLTFGQPLEECPASEENKKVPLVVEYCIREVERNGLKAEGIYRIPGKVALINSLSMDIDKGNYSQLDSGYDDIHTIGSLLKKFLKDLPDPLIPSNLYVHFINAARIPSERERMKTLKELVFNLPPVHYHTLKFLLTHLYKVSEYSEANKMNINNLCLVFGPTIVRDIGGSNELHAFQRGYNVIDPLLKNVKEFFHSDMCAEEVREEEEEQAREAANSRLEPEREDVDGHTHHCTSLGGKDVATPSPAAVHRSSLTPEGKRRFDTVGHNLSFPQNPPTGHRSSEGNIAAITEVGLSSPWESNHANVSSLESTGGSLWKQQPKKKKKLGRARLLIPFPPPPTGGVVQELNTPTSSNPSRHSLLDVDRARPHRRSMPAVSMDTVISNRDLVDDVPMEEVPRNQWVEEPSSTVSVTNLRHRSQMYPAIDMYRAQSAAEGLTRKGDPPEARSRDRSLSTSTHVANKISTSENSNSRRLPMESLL
ncbi:hypothetical protein EMCRGX_G013860 [Ephydatia muelleri]